MFQSFQQEILLFFYLIIFLDFNLICLYWHHVELQIKDRENLTK